MRQVGQHAVVIGASLGGLLAARALADYYDQVTVLERDTFPPAGEQRKGVPQGRHAHGLLARGRDILEDFFPGVTQQAIDQGAVSGDIIERARWFNEGAYHCQFSSGLQSLLLSRPRLEAQVRARLLALPNVRAIENADVLGVVASDDQTRITGVRLIRREAGSAEEILKADLVIDASGRGSRSPTWLEALGYAKPEEERVRVGVGYTTRLYRHKPEHLQGDTAVVVPAAPQTKRAGVMLVQEGERWIVTLAGYFGDHAPTDEQGFLEFARSLPTADIYEVIKDAEPLSDLVPAKFPASQRRHYERLTRFPDGFLVFGDAICSFNPIYAQGMTVAALEAVALQECLAEGTDRLAQRFFRRASKVVDIPWSIAVGNDLRFPEVAGPRSPMVRFINWYMSKLHVAARHDPVVALAFQKVANLMAPPPSVLHPAVALRVLRGNLRAGRTAGSVKSVPAPALTQG